MKNVFVELVSFGVVVMLGFIIGAAVFMIKTVRSCDTVGEFYVGEYTYSCSFYGVK